MKNNNIWILIIFLLLLGIIIVDTIKLKQHDSNNSKGELFVHTKIDSPPLIQEFSIQELKKYIKRLNIQHPDIVYAQAVLESGNFKSFLVKQNNNLFGMRMIGNRPTSSNGSKDGYAYFDTWQESVLDYCIYQCLYLSNNTQEEYLSYLERTYAEDPNYRNKIESMIQK